MLTTDSNLNSSTELNNSIAIDNCVFIAAQGRSGSTLLLRLLNAIDGYNICGENYGANRKLCQFYNTLVETYKVAPKNEGKLLSYQEIIAKPKNTPTYSGCEFYNIYELNPIKDKLRELILEMYNPNRNFKVWGFKEIRFGNGMTKKYWELKVELNFLKNLFPKAKFIFLTRKTEDVVKSAWWAKNPERSTKILNAQKDYFQKYNQENPSYTFALTYQDIINNTQNLQKMYDFLGESFNLESYQQVLAR